MLSDLDAPGLETRPNRDGTHRLYWCTRADLLKVGYLPKTVPLRYKLDDPADRILIEAACLRFQAEMLEWSSGRGRETARFDGTILGLSRYQVDEASPFKRLKHNTRAKDTYTLILIEKAFGTRSLAALKIGDFYRWYEAAKKPKAPGGSERVRRAHGIVKKLRELFAFGIMAELPECRRLKRCWNTPSSHSQRGAGSPWSPATSRRSLRRLSSWAGCRWRWAQPSNSRPRCARRT